MEQKIGRILLDFGL